MAEAARTPEEHFSESPLALAAFERVASLIEGLGGAEVKVSKTQIGFSRARGFAYVWTAPGRNPATSPAVVSLAFSHRIVSDRFRDVVQPRSNIWMHHLWIEDAAELDDEFATWLAAAYDDAAPTD
jgi:hypothetical protein